MNSFIYPIMSQRHRRAPEKLGLTHGTKQIKKNHSVSMKIFAVNTWKTTHRPFISSTHLKISGVWRHHFIAQKSLPTGKGNKRISGETDYTIVLSLTWWILGRPLEPFKRIFSMSSKCIISWEGNKTDWFSHFILKIEIWVL